LPWKTHLLGVFVIANTVFGVSIASVLFGTFCYRQRTFSARFVMAGTYFRCSLSSSICFSTLFVISGTLFRVLSADRVDF